MDNLVEIKQITPDAEPLNTEPSLPDDRNRRQCVWINEKGVNKDKQCTYDAFLDFKYCAAHVVTARKRGEEFKIKPIEEEDESSGEDEIPRLEEDIPEHKYDNIFESIPPPTLLSRKQTQNNELFELQKALKFEILKDLIKLTQTLFSE